MGKILIIDDNVGTTTLIENVLKNEGYEVVILNESVQAHDAISEELPDLILLDQMMPGMDGLSVLDELHHDKCLTKIPVIFFTALGDIKTKTAAYEAGARDFITKPIHPRELILRVRSMIEK